MSHIPSPPVRLKVLTFLLGASLSALTPAATPNQVETTKNGNTSNLSGISGRISQSPMNSGPVRLGQDRDAAPLAKVTVKLLNHKHLIVSTVVTDADGRFEIKAPADEYTLIVDVQAKLPRCDKTPVTIRAAHITHVEIDCDSGMR